MSTRLRRKDEQAALVAGAGRRRYMDEMMEAGFDSWEALQEAEEARENALLSLLADGMSL